MCYVYIIYSITVDKFYIGYTENLEQRIANHQVGLGNWTKNKGPWVLKYYETFDTVREGLQREIQLKKARNRKYFNWLVEHGPGYPVG